MDIREHTGTEYGTSRASSTSGADSDLCTVYVPTRAQRLYNAVFKRAFGFVLALLAVLLLSPIMLLCAIAIALESRGPIIFRQRRVGRDGREFYIYKFRSMRVSAPKYVATADLSNAHEYITKVGHFLRKTSLDELPQLFNVLKGDMSLIGYQPLVPSEGTIHPLRDRCGVHYLRPGITGLAQVNGRDLVTTEQKVRMDLLYLKQLSLWEDITILFKTVAVVFSKKDYAEGNEVYEIMLQQKSVNEQESAKTKSKLTDTQVLKKIS
ncbi:sugar transferase [Neobittarella massiliensis]|uniref:Sugar transferase n=1 Tax=Neobittarella massiliensis (ex Bilen et al. 2018) TaxID=2041842 RepID=A0A8J6IGQ8_9FIRM|nr:sugar transferase [Neobittarella massiliensis]MBC3516800.1 sugar transferase [Neobittarella massiliensis]